MKPIINDIGRGKPAIAIAGCLHGDEIIGSKVIKEISRGAKPGGNLLRFIVANPEAVKKKKRFLKIDLNRAFPGRKNGGFEEKLAYEIKDKLKGVDLVIDIHATNSNFDRLAIVTRLGRKEKKLLAKIPVKKVALVPPSVFGGKEMINHCRLGVALDYGPNKSGGNYKKALRDVRKILVNMGVIKGEKKIYPKKELFKVSGLYGVPKGFSQNKNLKDFRAIKEGSVIGSVRGKFVFSNLDFYPIFLGRGRYPKTLALISRKEKLNL